MTVQMRLSADERREELLDVAAELVVAHGVEALTMEGLAVSAGVSKGLGYKHFANSDQLLVALYEREMRVFDRRANEATTAVVPFEEKLHGLLDAMFDVVAERGALLGRLLQPSAGETPLAARQAQRSDAVVRFFGGIIAEQFDITPELARSAAKLLLAAANAAFGEWINRRMSRRTAAELVVRLTMGGLAELAANSADVKPSGVKEPSR